MKISESSKLVLFSTFLVLASVTISAADKTSSFLQCLSSQSQKANPISDAIYTPNNSSFTNIFQSYARNKRIFLLKSTRKPVAIVAAKDVSHVQATVLCAKKNGLQIRIRSGGHDYEGLSYASDIPFVILDMFNIRSIDIDMKKETAWVEAGAWLGELYYKIANTSNVHAFPAGVCPTLGVGGHFSGGGYGNMMRKYGLSVDNVIDARIVDAKGRILNRKSMGEDLFWAIRGGGGASFGVIVAWKIKLVQVPEQVTVFQVDKRTDQGATDLVLKWQEVAAAKLDPSLFIRLQISVINGSKAGEKTVQVSFIAMFLGSAKELVHLMSISFPELGIQIKDCQEMRWIESALFWSRIPKGTPLESLLDRTTLRPAYYFKFRSDYVKKPITRAGLESIWKTMVRVGEVTMQWNPYGGRMSQIPATATAFPHRAGYHFKIQYITVWMQGGEDVAGRYVNLSKTMFRGMTPFVTSNPREAFLNYRDLDVGSIGCNRNGSFRDAATYGLKFFKGNFNRLVKVKTAVDPENFFRYEQSIPVRNA